MDRFNGVIETFGPVKGTDGHRNKTLNNYTILNAIGEGSYGKVKLCTRGGSAFALKIINKGLLLRKREYFKKPDGGMGVRTALEDALSEIEIMKRLDHPNIVKLYEIIHDEDSEKIYLVMEYCEKGQILNWDVKTHTFKYPWLHSAMDEASLKKMFQGLAQGLEYLHSNNILHRDIKPQNIYVNSDFVPKIGDFGLAKILDSEDIHQKTVGTLHFLPPECCSAEVQNFRGKPVDVWELGLTLYTMTFLQLPFWAEGIAPLFEIIQNFQLALPNNSMSPEFEDLLRGMMEKNPETRLQISQVVKHSWLSR